MTIELATDDQAPIIVRSDAEGTYRFDGVTSRTASLTFRHINFAVLRRVVMVTPSTTRTVDAVLTCR